MIFLRFSHCFFSIVLNRLRFFAKQSAYICLLPKADRISIISSILGHKKNHPYVWQLAVLLSGV